MSTIIKNQQEVLLPIMENYDAIIIGASRETFFTLTSAIRSRAFLYEFKAFTKEEMNKILYIAFKDDITLTNGKKSI